MHRVADARSRGCEKMQMREDGLWGVMGCKKSQLREVGGMREIWEIEEDWEG